MRRSSITLLILSLTIPGCAEDPIAAVQHFREQLAAEGALVFLSNDGKFIGMDGDSAIILRDGAKATFLTYGFAFDAEPATYSVAPDGDFELKAARRGVVADFVIDEDRDTLILRPADRTAPANYRYRRLSRTEAQRYIADAQSSQ